MQTYGTTQLDTDISNRKGNGFGAGTNIGHRTVKASDPRPAWGSSGTTNKTRL